MGWFLGITVSKWWPRASAWTDTLMNPTKCLWHWEPDRRFRFVFNPPAYLCPVTYITEILLHVTLNSHIFISPWGPRGFIKKMRIGLPYPKRVVKGELMRRFLGITVKRVALCRCLDGHVKEPYEMSTALGARSLAIWFRSGVLRGIWIYASAHKTWREVFLAPF